MTDELQKSFQRVPDPGNPNYFVTSIEDPTIKGFADLPVYKGRRGVTDRLAILRPQEIAAARVHYIKDVGYIFCLSEYRIQRTSESDPGSEIMTKMGVCCEKLDPARKRMAVPIIRYRTDRDGNLLQPFDYELLIWRFGDRMFTQLASVAKDFPLSSHDLRVLCEDETYQRFMASATKESICTNAKFREQYGAAVDAFIASVQPRLKGMLAQSMAAAEVAEKLGSEPARVSADEVANSVSEMLKDLPF